MTDDPLKPLSLFDLPDKKQHRSCRFRHYVKYYTAG